ncbi:hypothetical protein WDW86_03120 [Bdellovibrionota bacterium FG-2]
MGNNAVFHITRVVQLVPPLLFTIIFATHSALARDIVFGKARETIPVAFGTETIFRFPMEVKTITEASKFDIRPANADEPDYSVLTVKPRFAEGSADVTFLLSDGTPIRTQLVVATRSNLKRDSIYDFKAKLELGDTNPNLKDHADPIVISELDLMRAMIRGDQVAGFNSTNYSQPISLGSPNLTAELKRVYRGHDMNGYVYILKTGLKESSFEISLDALAIGQPNLAILAQVDRAFIGGKTPEEREAYLRVVARPGASSQRIILPVALKSERDKK